MIPGVEEGEVAVSREGPGAQLRRERQRRRLEITSVARELHLQAKAVAALEADNLEELPEPVYVRGYIKNYAALMGLDAEPLLNDFNRVAPDKSGPVLVDKTLRPQMRSSHALVRLTTVLVIIALAALLVLWLRDHDGAFDLSLGDGNGALTDAVEEPRAPESVVQGFTPPQEEPQPDITLEAEPLSVSPTMPRADDRAPSLSSDAVPPAPTPVASVAPAAVAEQPVEQQGEAAPAAAEPASEPELAPPPSELRVGGGSWVDVRDADGKRVVRGSIKAGSTVELTGPRPWRFVVGNASEVQLVIDGKPVDLTPHISGNVARATLPAADSP